MMGSETIAAAEAVTTFGDLERYPWSHGVTVVALTGKRRVGKSTFASVLEREYGFKRVHAFETGKKMARVLFAQMTGSYREAERMVDGDLKDLPHTSLPGCATPRYFMERFGKFMGVDMGVPWTLAMEMNAAIREGATRIVVESVVYESDEIAKWGGNIIRLRGTRQTGIEVETDATQDAIKVQFDLQHATPEAVEMSARWYASEILELLPVPTTVNEPDKRFLPFTSETRH